ATVMPNRNATSPPNPRSAHPITWPTFPAEPLGNEVPDRLRGRVFAFLQTAVRVCLIVAISASGVLVGVGSSRHFRIGPVGVELSTARALLAVAGLSGVGLGMAAFRQMDDRPGVPLLRDLWAVLRRRSPDAPAGLYVVIYGLDPLMATAHYGALAARLRQLGLPVLLAGSPADTRMMRAAMARGVVAIAGLALPPPGSGTAAAGVPVPDGWTPLQAKPRPDLTVFLSRQPAREQLSRVTTNPGTEQVLVLDSGHDPAELAVEISARVVELRRAANCSRRARQDREDEPRTG
ncbi:hypothetical protein AB0M47_20350, partial [Hamadaea sp. NPDC051192]